MALNGFKIRCRVFVFMQMRGFLTGEKCFLREEPGFGEIARAFGAGFSARIAIPITVEHGWGRCLDGEIDNRPVFTDLKV
jgi:hypothetical protein